jgi:hypothetical protein
VQQHLSRHVHSAGLPPESSKGRRAHQLRPQGIKFLNITRLGCPTNCQSEAASLTRWLQAEQKTRSAWCTKGSNASKRHSQPQVSYPVNGFTGRPAPWRLLFAPSSHQKQKKTTLALAAKQPQTSEHTSAASQEGQHLGDCLAPKLTAVTKTPTLALAVITHLK